MSGEELPFGWTEQVAAKDGEHLKFYYNVITGHKFYCKADLIHYVELGSPSLGTAQQICSPQNDSKPMATETQNIPDWLPQGWIMELKVGIYGRKHKEYTDPLTGRKFMSKPEVLRFLHSEKENDPVSEQTPVGVESDNNGKINGPETSLKPEGSHTLKDPSSQSSLKMTSSCHPTKKKVEIVRCEAEGLPEGWIKEIKIEMIGKKIRKDPYYTDPKSEYVFRSTPDVLRFLETKDLKSCAMRPRKREDLKFLSDDTSILEETQALNNEAEENIKKEENDAPTIDQPSKTSLSKRKRGRPRAAPSTDSITNQEKPDNDSTKSEGEKEKSDNDSTKSEGEKILEEKQALNNEAEENIKKEGNDAPTTDQPPKTSLSKRKRGRPRVAPSIDSITNQEILDNESTKSEGEKILEEKKALNNEAEENIKNEENDAPTTDQPPKTPLSKRKRGRPRVAPSIDSITNQEIPDNDSTKSEGEKILEEKPALNYEADENIKNEENDVPTTDQSPKTPLSKRKRGRPRVAPSTDSITNQEKPDNDSAKPEGEKVNGTSSRSSKRITRGNGGTEENLLGGSSLDPLSEFAFKNLRSDIPVDANNLAAQGYDHQKRTNIGLPSFSDYARR